MSPTADKKDSFDFLSDYYFNTKSPVTFIKPGSHITVMVSAVPAVVSKAEYDYGTYGTAGGVQSCLRYRRYRTVKEKQSHESLLKWSSS